MATRGTPLPMEVRNEIVRMLQAGASWRTVMREVRVGMGSVQKYRVHRMERRRTDDDFAEVAAAWPNLTEAMRRSILRIVRS